MAIVADLIAEKLRRFTGSGSKGQQGLRSPNGVRASGRWPRTGDTRPSTTPIMSAFPESGGRRELRRRLRSYRRPLGGRARRSSSPTRRACSTTRWPTPRWRSSLMAVRRLPQAERYLREGEWLKGAVSPHGLAARPHDGRARPRPDRQGDRGTGEEPSASRSSITAAASRRTSPTATMPRSSTMAKACDILMVSAPGGPDTRHVVDAEILRALGPDGVLVNIARGSLVDEAGADRGAARPARFSPPASTCSRTSRMSRPN